MTLVFLLNNHDFYVSYLVSNADDTYIAKAGKVFGLSWYLIYSSILELTYVITIATAFIYFCTSRIEKLKHYLIHSGIVAVLLLVFMGLLNFFFSEGQEVKLPDIDVNPQELLSQNKILPLQNGILIHSRLNWKEPQNLTIIRNDNLQTVTGYGTISLLGTKINIDILKGKIDNFKSNIRSSDYIFTKKLSYNLSDKIKPFVSPDNIINKLTSHLKKYNINVDKVLSHFRPAVYERNHETQYWMFIIVALGILILSIGLGGLLITYDQPLLSLISIIIGLIAIFIGIPNFVMLIDRVFDNPEIIIHVISICVLGIIFYCLSILKIVNVRR